MQVTDNIATTTYRVLLVWVAKNGKEQSAKFRVIHTWVRDTDGTWQIISGMSAPHQHRGKLKGEQKRQVVPLRLPAALKTLRARTRTIPNKRPVVHGSEVAR